MSTSSPKVSVVIPSHNYARFLPEALDSVLNQTVAPHEILVVDDSSTDHTPEVVAAYGNSVKYIRVEHRGAYGARNDSLAHLSGDFFLNLDADNRLKPEMTEATLETLLRADDTVGYVYTQRAYIGKRGGTSSFPEFDARRLRLQNYVDMCSLIRMPLVKQFRFDEHFNRGCGDHAFFLRLLSRDIRGLLLDRPLLEYRMHGDSITGQVNRKYHQMAICRQLIETFPELYPPDIRREAIDAARNRTLVAILANRAPQSPLTQRFRDLLCFIRTNPRHAELRNQFRFLLRPGEFQEAF